MSHSIDDLVSQVAAEDTAIDSVVALVGGLKQQLADVLSGATLPAGVQAKIDSLFDDATNKAAEITTAIGV